MIGHYLLTLTPEQEDRILTRPMEGYRDGDPGENLCLLEIIGGGYDRFYQEDHPGIIEWRDFLCERVQEEIVAKETGVSSGVHELRLWTSVDRRYRYFEGWFEAFYQRPIGTRSAALYQNPGFGAVNVEVAQTAGASFGLEGHVF